MLCVLRGILRSFKVYFNLNWLLCGLNNGLIVAVRRLMEPLYNKKTINNTIYFTSDHYNFILRSISAA